MKKDIQKLITEKKEKLSTLVSQINALQEQIRHLSEEAYRLEGGIRTLEELSNGKNDS